MGAVLKNAIPQLVEASSRLLKKSGLCNEVVRGASHWTCEEMTSSRDMFLATSLRSSGYAKIIRCDRSAQW